MKRNYYDYIKEQIESARFQSSELDGAIRYIPDLFNVLCGTLDEDILTQEDRMILYCALGYLVTPSDMLPEEVYGSKGFMDDLFIIVVVLKEIYEKYPDNVKKYWYNNVDDKDFETVLELCYSRSENMLEEENLKEKIEDFKRQGCALFG